MDLLSPEKKANPVEEPDKVDWLEVEKWVWKQVLGAESLLANMRSQSLGRMDPMLESAIVAQVVGGYGAAANVRAVRQNMELAQRLSAIEAHLGIETTGG